MNYLSFIFRICADELYFFTFILFINFKVSKNHFKSFFLFFQAIILFYQITALRSFPIGIIFLILASIICIQFILKYKLSYSFQISIQFTLAHYILSILVGILLFFIDFQHISLPNFYEDFIYNNIEYYSLKDIFASCVSSIILILWLSRSRLKQLRQKSHYDPITYTVLGVIAIAILILTYIFLYGSNTVTPEDIILVSIIFIVSILLVMLWIVNKIVLTLQSQFFLEQQLRKGELERNYYDAISTSLSKLAKLRHDFKNYLAILQQYLSDGNHFAASSFISEISEEIMPSLQVIVTGNQTISAILNTKQEDCQRYHIQFKTHIEFNQIFLLSTLDLITVFGNLLDNAITATQKVDPEDRYIDLSIIQIDSHLYIICKNSFNGEINEKNGRLFSTKKTTELSYHGIGIANMKEVVTRNNGTLDYQYTKSVFTVEIMIPNYE